MQPALDGQVQSCVATFEQYDKMKTSGMSFAQISGMMGVFCRPTDDDKKQCLVMSSIPNLSTVEGLPELSEYKLHGHTTLQHTLFPQK